MNAYTQIDRYTYLLLVLFLLWTLIATHMYTPTNNNRCSRHYLSFLFIMNFDATYLMFVQTSKSILYPIKGS